MVGFVAPLAVAILGPATGQLLDSSPRQLSLNVCAITQGVCITASGDDTGIVHVRLLRRQQCGSRSEGMMEKSCPATTAHVFAVKAVYLCVKQPVHEG